VRLLSIGWITALQQGALQSCHGGWSEVHLHTIKLYQSLELGQQCIPGGTVQVQVGCAAAGAEHCCASRGQVAQPIAGAQLNCSQSDA